MLAENQSMLMLFEFFAGLDITRRFSTEPLAGKEFAALLSQDSPAVTMVTRRGYEIAEVVYPYDADSRYQRKQAIPWILAAALARMSDDPDALFDETIAFASRLPRQHLSSHYRQLFDWLSQRRGRDLWIEKSGSSIEYLDSLHVFYPDARFLHLHRNGLEAALSMREHHVYRLWVSLMFGSGEEVRIANAELGEFDVETRPETTEAITQLLDSQPPVEYFGRYWTDLIARGFRGLGRLNADQYLEVRFEDLVAKPREVLRAIRDFFELDAGQGEWIDRAAALVRGIPPTRFEKLSAREQERLSDACRVGQQLLGQLA
jgi:putative sulfotransferase